MLESTHRKRNRKHKMNSSPNLFTGKSGNSVSVDFTNSSCINDREYGKVMAKVEFQNQATCNVAGLVYVSFVPKGKRKVRTIAVNQDRLSLI